jgi:nicotinamidase-related amidase
MQEHAPRRPALLVIDMQAGLFDATEQPYERERILDNINDLIRSARAAGAPVLAARHIGPADSPMAPGSPATRLVDRLDVAPQSDHVFDKTRPNCFFGTALMEQLERAGTDELVVVGMKTQYCVDTTCRAAAERGLRVVLIEDAHTCTDTPVLAARQIIDHHNATLRGAFAAVIPAAAYRFG